MKKSRKKKRPPRTHTGTSTAKNIGLLLLSLGMVFGAGFLYVYITDMSNITLDPLQKAISGMTGPAAGEAQTPQGSAPGDHRDPPPQVAGAYEFTFYDLLASREASQSTDQHYSVQIATFSTRDHAEEFVRSLSGESGLSFRIDKNGRLFHVRWGSFSSRETAQRQCTRIAGKLQRECIVVRQ